MSTFHGLEMAKQALFAQQSALYTTGHNIANANTEGYSRQRVNFEADMAYPAAARNRPGIPGQIGTGVKAGAIQRIRNEFLDLQYRGENSLAGYWETRAEALGRMESLMNELNETGLSKTMDQLWHSLQDLALNPTDAGARSVVLQRGIALAETFNHYNTSLKKIRSDLKQEIDTTANRANIILESIDNLNDQIKNLETNGYLPNDLYDRRDMLIDELSKMMDIDITIDASSHAAQDIAEGLVTIRTNGVTLVDGVNGGYNQIYISSVEQDDSSGSPAYVQAIQVFNELSEDGLPVGEPLGQIDIPQQQGTIQSLIKAYGYGNGANVEGDYVKMLTTLADIAEVFKNAFNEVQENGYHMEKEDEESYPFFMIDENGVMTVNPEIINNPNLIAASGEEGAMGDGSNALRLADVFDDVLTFDDGREASVKEYYTSVVGDLAVQVEESERMSTNTNVLLTQVESQRLSVRSVSLDEEMTNMIKFQHAYNAAARSMTTTDELLDRIINSMGLVGR